MMREWGQVLGNPACPSLKRWMLQTRFGSVRLHHWLGEDDSRALHNHPWWFLTIVLSGGYDDEGHPGRKVDRLHTGSIRLRRPQWLHRVVPRGNCWTLVFTSAAKSEWGFRMLDHLGIFYEATRYAWAFGDAPCQEGDE